MNCTLADLLAFLRDGLPRAETEIGGLVDGLSCNLSVVFIVEGEHSAQKQIDDHTQAPQVDFLAIGLLKKDLWGNVGL